MERRKKLAEKAKAAIESGSEEAAKLGWRIQPHKKGSLKEARRELARATEEWEAILALQ